MEFVIQDSAGNALSGVSVEVRRQGAQVNGAHAGVNTSFTVDDPGGITAADTVSVNTGSVARAVSSVTATTVVVGGAGFSNLADDDRLTIVSALPTLYNDTVGNETKANPLTTDATGYAFCYLLGGKYDVLVSGGGATTRLYQDMACNGGETMRSNIYSGTAWNLDTLRSMSATDLLLALQSAGVTKFSVAGDGEIVAGAAGAAHSLTGSLAVSNGAAVTGAVTATTSVSATTTVTAGTGVTATTGNIQATAGDVLGRRLEFRKGTALATGDFALSAGWGTTATVSFIAGEDTPRDTRGCFRVTSTGTGQAADPTITITLKDGTYPQRGAVIANRKAGSQKGTHVTSTFGGVSAEVVILQWIGTPVAAETYDFNYIVMG